MPVWAQTGSLGTGSLAETWEQCGGFGIVHVLFQPARNHVFGFDFSATAFMGSKGLAQPPH